MIDSQTIHSDFFECLKFGKILSFFFHGLSQLYTFCQNASIEFGFTKRFFDDIKRVDFSQPWNKPGLMKPTAVSVLFSWYALFWFWRWPLQPFTKRELLCPRGLGAALVHVFGGIYPNMFKWTWIFAWWFQVLFSQIWDDCLRWRAYFWDASKLQSGVYIYIYIYIYCNIYIYIYI